MFTERIDLNKMLGQLNRILNLDIKPTYIDPRPGDIMHSRADISLAREILGYKPLVSFEDRLLETVRWYQEDRKEIDN